MRRRWIGWGIGVLAVILAVMTVVFIIETLSMLDLGKIKAPAQSTVLYDRSDEPAATLSGSENRTVVPLHDLPEHAADAFIAAEDARFFRHPGVDVKRIGGALLSNLRAGGYAQGASTVTQQLVKLTHLSSEKTLLRKAREAILALRLETLMSKDEILEAYLNTVYFGEGAYGIEAASSAYFGVPSSDLDVNQAATLAAIIKSPTNYNPRRHPESALKRRNVVLGEMADNGYLSEADARELAALPLPEIVPARQAPYPWYVDQAADEACALLAIDREALLSGGYRLYTALDPALQQSAEALIREAQYFPADAADGEKAQAALACTDVQNGELLCLIGGRTYETARGLNRASGMLRQPGSAFKPVSVYAAAVDRFGFLPVSLLDDTRRAFAGGYMPVNFGDTYAGTVTVREALARSLNVATVDLLEKTGVTAARQYAQMAGLVLSDDDANLSLGLGALTDGVSPLALCAAYAPLANGGAAYAPRAIRRIEDARGRTLYEAKSEPRRVMAETSARLITDMLLSAAEWGSARALGQIGFPAAGKTGTVGMQGGGNRDVWTVAYTRRAAVAVWMGFDRPDAAHRLPDAVTGSSHPAKLAAAFLGDNRARLDGGRFPIPDGLAQVLVDLRALEKKGVPMLVSDLTPPSQTRAELFPISQVPRRVSDVWKKPGRVFDLRAQPVEGGVRLTFTCVDDWALYRLYRDGVPIAELTGARGDALAFIDFSTDGSASYSVTPVHAELEAEGIALAGDPSRSVSAGRPPQSEAPEAESETPAPAREEALFA